MPGGVTLRAFVVLLSLTLLPGVASAQVTSADMGSGVGWIDCNVDGIIDVVYLTPTGQIVVMENNGDGSFSDVSETSIPAGVVAVGNPALGIVSGDVNNDGAPDMFLTLHGQNFLLLNDGAGSFSAVSRQAGITGEVMSASGAMLDYDNDGLLDIYVVNYEGQPNQMFHCTGISKEGVPSYENVSEALGVDLAPNGQSDWGLGVTVADFDNDGDTDMYIGNDYNGVGKGVLNPGDNIYFRNNGDGTFTDATDAAGLRDVGWAMGVAHGDYNNDGFEDIFVANFFEDVLYKNNGDGTFTEATETAGIITGANGEWHYNGWGTSFIDFDNDGDLDIHVANGFIPNDQGQIDDEPDQLFENKGASAGYTFVEVTEESGIGQVGDARGAGYGDFNGDGLIDIFVVNNDFLNNGSNETIYPSRYFFINMGDGTFQDRASSLGFRDTFADGERFTPYRDFKDNKWLGVGVEGVTSNASGIGSRIALKAGGKTYYRQVGVSSYCSQNSPFEHFGLGDLTQVDEITVTFPSGNVTTVTEGIGLNKNITIREDFGVPVRLLGFDLAPVDEGVRMSWRYEDDGDLMAFRVTRRDLSGSEVIASNVLGRDGAASVFDAAPPVGIDLEYSLDALLRDGSWQNLKSGNTRFEARAWVLGQNLPNPHAFEHAHSFGRTGCR